MPPLPASARIEVPAALARDLKRAVEAQPDYDNKDFYSLKVQAELHDAIRVAVGDGFDWLVEEIRSRLRRGPYCALVGGLAFDERNRLFVAVNRAFGDLVARPYQEPRAQLVHYIQPATDIKAADGRQTETERLHTDSADWPEPVEVISMVCIRPDRAGGGRSHVLDVATLRDEIAERLGREAVELLEREAVPWQIADYLGGGVVWRPILGASTVRWRRYTIDAAPQAADLSGALAETLDRLERLIARTDRVFEFLMAEGEWLFMDNHRTLHSRTPIRGDRQTSGRLMLRSWIQSNEGSLSPSAAATG